MQNVYLLSVLLIPLLTAITILFLWGKVLTQKIVGAISSILYLFAAILLFNQVLKSGMAIENVGNWPLGFGIVLVVDQLSAIFLMLSAIVSFVAFLYGSSFIESKASLTVFQIGRAHV